MSYPKQVSVADRLQSQSLDALHAMREEGWNKIDLSWKDCRFDLRSHISQTYHEFFGNETWTLIGLKASGAWGILAGGIHSRMTQFREESRAIAKECVNTLYRDSLFRHAWVLDQTTPPNIKIRIPHKHKLLEAQAIRNQINYYRGDEAVQKFNERWDLWNDAYAAALINNLQLGAINGSSAGDASDEVDATRANTPAYGILDALQRLFDFESNVAINQAIYNLDDVNEEAGVQMIWETRRDLRVCDDCDANEGLPEAEADGYIPLHPNCHCYWRIVPKSWAELLRSGNQDDYQTAILMDAKGLVPNSMVIRDNSGRLAGFTSIQFDDWIENNYGAALAQ